MKSMFPTLFRDMNICGKREKMLSILEKSTF